MTGDVMKFLKEKQNQLIKEALVINDCLIDYDQGGAEYTKEEVNKMCLDRDKKEQKATFISELLDEIQKN